MIYTTFIKKRIFLFKRIFFAVLWNTNPQTDRFQTITSKNTQFAYHLSVSYPTNFSIVEFGSIHEFTWSFIIQYPLIALRESFQVLIN